MNSGTLPPIRILYLDDEEQNLLSFKALFRGKYEVLTTTSAAEAVQFLQKHQIHVIFSDQKMPDISGVEFFELIRPDFPDPIRVLLTGYADIEAVIDAINKGQVYRYLTKPWVENELRITIEDAYEMYESRLQLKEKTEALQKAYSELEKFVYSASHDLRAPLVTIKGIVKLARLDQSPEKFTEYLDMMESSIVKLDAFVTNIIHYYQNSKFDEIKRPLNFSEIIDDCFEQLRHFSGKRHIQFHKEVTGTGNFEGDELRIKVILNNLLSNAVKFMDDSKAEKRIDVSVNLSAVKAVIRITDNGPGISPEDQPHIFDLFYKSATKSVGSGLGLYIVKEAVEKLKGKISVTSGLESGTCFQIEIPNKQ